MFSFFTRRNHKLNKRYCLKCGRPIFGENSKYCADHQNNLKKNQDRNNIKLHKENRYITPKYSYQEANGIVRGGSWYVRETGEEIDRIKLSKNMSLNTNCTNLTIEEREAIVFTCIKTVLRKKSQREFYSIAQSFKVDYRKKTKKKIIYSVAHEIYIHMSVTEREALMYKIWGVEWIKAIL